MAQSNLAIIVICGLMLGGLTGCPSTPTGKTSTIHSPEQARYKIGAALGDLTPPPGYPMGGHSIAGEISRGWWLRPCVRTIFLQDRAGHALVLVSCELWSFPAGLGDRIAELVKSDGLARSQLVLCATHTHHSPGNFSSSAFYNAFGSKEGGFDPRLMEFLAIRIAHTIEQAKSGAQDGSVSFGQTRLMGAARNRSFQAFGHDPESAGIVGENQDLPVGKTNEIFPSPEAFRAIDPTMSVLKMSDNTGRPIAMAVFAAMHPTTMSHDFLLYSGELFGAVSLVAEQRLEQVACPPLRGNRYATSRPQLMQSAPDAVGKTVDADDLPPDRVGPVVAMFNGAEGDVSPNWMTQGRAVTLNLAEQIAGKAIDTQCKPIDTSAIEERFEVATLAGASFVDADGERRQVDDLPIPGVGTLGGAEDGKTFLHALGFGERVSTITSPTQGNKQPAMDIRGIATPITRTFVSRTSHPTQVPLGVYRIGDLTLATLPGEFTTVMGRRIRWSVAGVMSPNHIEASRVLLVGLCNEYVSYFTTPEEYAAQDYEGASTMYGPWSGPFIGHELALVAGRPADVGPTSTLHVDYDPGTEHQFEASSLTPLSYWRRNAYDDVLQDAGGHVSKNLPVFDWVDIQPRVDAGQTLPEAWIQQLDAWGHWSSSIGGEAETDRGLDIPVMLTDCREATAHWRAYWIPPARATVGETYRFSVRKVDGTVVHSSGFVLQKALHL